MEEFKKEIDDFDKFIDYIYEISEMENVSWNVKVELSEKFSKDIRSLKEKLGSENIIGLFENKILEIKNPDLCCAFALEVDGADIEKHREVLKGTSYESTFDYRLKIALTERGRDLDKERIEELEKYENVCKYKEIMDDPNVIEYIKLTSKRMKKIELKLD